jgi:hypothetical protein
LLARVFREAGAGFGAVAATFLARGVGGAPSSGPACVAFTGLVRFLAVFAGGVGTETGSSGVVRFFAGIYLCRIVRVVVNPAVYHAVTVPS